MYQPAYGFTFRVGVTNTKRIAGSPNAYRKPGFATDAQLLNLKNGRETSQSLEFGNAYVLPGEGIVQIGRSVSDGDGNLYITGGFNGSITLGGTTYESTQGYDLFLAKVGANDELEWIRTGKGAQLSEDYFSLDGGLAMAVDSENNLYIGGGFVQSLTFCDVAGDSLFGLTGSSTGDLNLEVFVAKYNSEGDFLWAMGGESGSTGSAASLAEGRNVVADIAIDNNDFPYVIGSFTGTNLFGTEVVSAGGSDIFLASLDKNGNSPFWVSTFGTPGDDNGISVSTDRIGYLNILTSINQGVIEFPDSNIYWDNDTGADDTMVMSFDVDGTWYFASFIGAGESVVGIDIESTAGGSFYVTGSFSGQASFAGSDIVLEVPPAVVDGYLVKYDLNGDAIWARQFGNGFAEGLKVTTDVYENAYVLGSFSESIVFAADTEDPVVLTTTAENDLFIAKYDSAGTFLWVKQISGSGSKSQDRIARESVPFRTVPIDFFYAEGAGDLFVFGDFSGDLTLDPFTLTTAANNQSGFIAKLNVAEGTSGPGELQEVTLTGSAGWRMMSVPTASATFASLLDNVWTQGFAGASSTGGDANVRLFNGSSWVAPANLSTTIGAGTGFIFNPFEDDDFVAAGIQGGFPKTLSITGTENASGVAPALNSGIGAWTLVGNPFASSIDADLLTKSGVNNVVYLWSPSANDYLSWNGTEGGLTNGLIAPFQGFFIQSAGESPTLTFNDGAKTTGATFNGKTAATFRAVLKAEGVGHENTAIVAFSDDGKIGFDSRDAWYINPLSSDYMHIMTLLPGTTWGLKTNNLPAGLSEELVIKADIKTTRSGEITIKCTDFNLPAGWRLTLRDLQTGATANLTAGETLTATITVTAKVTNESHFVPETVEIAQTRFELIVNPEIQTAAEDRGLPATLRLNQNYPNPFNPSTGISFELPAQGDATLSVFDLTGRLVDIITEGVKAAGTHTVSWNGSKQASGVYILRLETAGQVLIRKMTLLK
jgi:hypothetical protein